MSKAIVTSAMREVGLVAELLCETGERERERERNPSQGLLLYHSLKLVKEVGSRSLTRISRAPPRHQRLFREVKILKAWYCAGETEQTLDPVTEYASGGRCSITELITAA